MMWEHGKLLVDYNDTAVCFTYLADNKTVPYEDRMAAFAALEKERWELVSVLCFDSKTELNVWHYYFKRQKRGVILA